MSAEQRNIAKRLVLRMIAINEGRINPTAPSLGKAFMDDVSDLCCAILAREDWDELAARLPATSVKENG